MDCVVHGVAKSWTGQSDFHFDFHNICCLWVIGVTGETDHIMCFPQWICIIILIESEKWFLYLVVALFMCVYLKGERKPTQRVGAVEDRGTGVVEYNKVVKHIENMETSLVLVGYIRILQFIHCSWIFDILSKRRILLMSLVLHLIAKL